MRITGLASGLDMDQVVKDSMKPYRMRVDETKQKKDIIEMKQQLYRDVLKDSQEFYNKHFDVLKPDSLLSSKNWGTTSFSSSNESVVSVSGEAGAIQGNYSVTVDQIASKATAVYKMEDMKNTKSFELNFGDKKVTINNITDAELEDPSKLVSRINKELVKEKVDIEVKYSEFSSGLVFESKVTGEETGSPAVKNQIKITATDKTDNVLQFTDSKGNKVSELNGIGKDAIVSITNSRGEVQTYTGSKNSVTFDGITFSFNDITHKPNADGTVGIHTPIKISGKQDVTSTKDKIVAFVDDYNKIMEKLNDQILKKPNKTYQPLTQEQKDEMSEDEIKLWNQKVKEGQLYRDSDLTRIANGMKGIMSSMMGTLEKFGIEPVQDFSGSKNGTLKIDPTKLEEGLKNNSKELMDAFIGKKDSSITGSQDGIMHRMKDFLYNETITITSPLIKKVGLDNSSTSGNNELSKSIEKYNKKIADLEKDFARREQALYSKYARLEVQMNNFNSQQSYLAQQLG